MMSQRQRSGGSRRGEAARACRGGRGWGWVLAVVFAWAAPAWAGEAEIKAANSLMDRGLFNDAVKTLLPVVEQQGDANSGVELRLLGEAYYMQKKYGEARTYYERALPRQTNTKAKISCEARLANIDYRLGDPDAATERIENFLRNYPTDSRVGSMVLMQIRIIQERRMPDADKLKKIEELYKTILSDKERYGYYNVALAAQSLGELYVAANNEGKAIELFVTAAHEMRGLIANMQAAGRAVPPDMAQGVDGLALQIGRFYLVRKRWDEAKKWLYNVSLTEDLKAQAKYLLAQIAYQQREYREATTLLTDGVLSQLPDGETRSAMFLLLGLCWRGMEPPNLEKAKEYLKQVPATAAAFYYQAQFTLGDIYRAQKDGERAEPHFLAAVKDPNYAAAALFGLGVICKDRAAATSGATDKDKAARAALLSKAGAYFQELQLRYPLTDLAVQAKPLVEELRRLGVTVVTEPTDEEKVAKWEKTIKEQPQTNEAAQALISLAKHHTRFIRDPRSKAVIKAPNWAACARACQPLVQSQTPYAGVAPERWRELRRQALCQLARAELGSLAPSAHAVQQKLPVEPVRMDGGGSTERALKYLAEAKSLLADANTKRDELREIEYAQIEAMAKSTKPEVREQGEKLYLDREADYGKDPGYLPLALFIADWQAEQGRFELAGKTYRNLARKYQNDQTEQALHLLHLAGMSYGRGGRAALGRRDQGATLVFEIKPPTVLKTAVEEPVLKTHPLFARTKRLPWEAQGPDLPAGEVLRKVSSEFGVPFVWAPDETAGSVAHYLKRTAVPRATLRAWREPVTLGRVLTELFDPQRFGVDFDLGLSGGTPTFELKPDDDNLTDEVQTVEIYPTQRERFAALAKPYGALSAVHKGAPMWYNILKRVEEVTRGRVVWSDGVQKDEVLAREFGRIPGLDPGANPTCRQVLDRTVEAVGLRYRVVAREYSRELLLQSIECFDDLRKYGSTSAYAEDAMFNIAVNMYYLKDYAQMKLVLKEYLKTYDTPTFAHYYDACFWLGRLFEIERKYREAVKYYILATDEKLVLFRPVTEAPSPSLDELKARLGYETLFNLSRKGSHAFTVAPLEGKDGVLHVIRFFTNVDIAVDPSAQGLEVPINRDILGVPCLELLHECMAKLFLDLRTENGDREVAEKAYYRMALVYKEDNLMREALENIQTLLRRFPQSPRLVDALKLKLEINKGLRDYGAVLATLKELQTVAAGKIEPYLLEYEVGRVYFDLCNYPEAAACFERALKGTQKREELAKIREALALAYLRLENRERDAIALYRENLLTETAPLRQTVYTMTIRWLELAVSQPRTRRPLPANEAAFLADYEKASDAERAALSPEDLARATWIYYGLGREELLADQPDNALAKFDAASTSPDGSLAADALYQSALIHRTRGEQAKARECLEHLLFTTSAVESKVKATFALAECLTALGEREAAFRRLNEVVTRYPVSPFAALARKHPLFVEHTNSEGANQP